MDEKNAAKLDRIVQQLADLSVNVAASNGAIAERLARVETQVVHVQESTKRIWDRIDTLASDHDQRLARIERIDPDILADIEGRLIQLEKESPDRRQQLKVAGGGAAVGGGLLALADFLLHYIGIK